MEKRRKKKKSDDWLTDNGVGAEGAKALSEMLKVNTTLTSLNIRSERGKGWKEKEKKIEESLIDRQWDWN